MKKLGCLAFVGVFVLILVSVITIVSSSKSSKPSAPATVHESSIQDSPTPKVTSSSTPPGLTDGTYLVGTDIKAGTYKTPGPGSMDVLDSCYWERDSNDSGTFEAIIANGDITGPGRITVNAGEILNLSGDCSWSLVAK